MALLFLAFLEIHSHPREGRQQPGKVFPFVLGGLLEVWDGGRRKKPGAVAGSKNRAEKDRASSQSRMSLWQGWRDGEIRSPCPLRIMMGSLGAF